MNTGAGDITGLVEEALWRYLLAADISWCPDEQIYRGIENLETQEMEGQDSSLRRLPCIVIACQRAAPVDPYYAGNWDPAVTVEVLSQRDDTTNAAHKLRVREVFNEFLTDTIAEDLSAIMDDWYVAFVVPGEQSYSIRGRVWVSELALTLRNVCARDVE
jgi:hypothetical protein